MANLPTGLDNIDLTKGGFYTLINELRAFLSGSIGEIGTPEGAKIALSLDSVDNTPDIDKPISTLTQTALDSKQATLQSSVNIKTINGESLLGSSNISIVNTDTNTWRPLSNSVTSTSSSVSASSYAAKIAYDKGVSAYSLASGKISSSGVATTIKGFSAGAVGTYAFLYYINNDISSAGQTATGSNLRWAGIEESTDALQYSTAPSGTWRAMGYPDTGSGSGTGFATLWLRIA